MGEIIKSIETYVLHNQFDMSRDMSRQLLQLNYIKDLCDKFPACDGCPLNKKYIGCLFRQGKTPKEW